MVKGPEWGRYCLLDQEGKKSFLYLRTYRLLSLSLGLFLSLSPWDSEYMGWNSCLHQYQIQIIESNHKKFSNNFPSFEVDSFLLIRLRKNAQGYPRAQQKENLLSIL